MGKVKMPAMAKQIRNLALFIFCFPCGAAHADPALIAKGKALFTAKACIGCHTIGEGDRSGPDLKGVFDRRDLTWVQKWLKSTDAMFAANDPTAQQLAKKYALRMPDQGLAPDEITQLIAYIAASGGGTPVARPETVSADAKTDGAQAGAQAAAEGPLDVKALTGASLSIWDRVKAFFGVGSSASSSLSLNDIIKERGLTQADILAAVKTYTPSGKHDPYIMFASGGHNGGVLVIGIPSMRILKTIPVFTPDSWHGYAVGSSETQKLLDDSSRPGGPHLRWGDVHHPALSETNGVYDGQFLFVNDKADARVAVIDLKDFTTKQIVTNPLFVNDHGGTFASPNTDYVVETSQYNIPLPNHFEPITKFTQKYHGVTTLWKFDREKGRIDPRRSFSIELPPYWQDIADFGKGPSDGYYFINSINSEQALGGNLGGQPSFEIGASKNDMDFLHVINWKKAEQVFKEGKTTTVAGMKLITLETAIKEGVLTLVYEPKSPHGVDVTPDGQFIIISGKLDPHTSVFSIEKIKKAIADKNYDGKDKYGIPILKFDAVLEAQVEVGLGPLHTQFDSKGFAYTSLFLDSAIAKWTIGGKFHKGADAWRLVDKVQVQYNPGHLSCVEGDSAQPGFGYCVALNKWAIDRFQPVGPLLPQNFQLIDTTGEKMKVVYDLPIPNAEPHYTQIIKASVLKPLQVYPMGTDAITMKQSPFFTAGDKERIDRQGKNVTVFMTLMRSHIKPDRIEVNKGDHVTIHLSNIETAHDATHGFAISDYNINVSMEPGKVETLNFVAEKAGVFPFYCTEFCSALHLEMAGYLLVK